MGSLPKVKKKDFPKSINDMSEEKLRETLKKKKECDAKALAIVENLCESDVEEEWFLANLQFINQTHFDDVTVERAISKLCGYPLCSQKLEKIPTQQYRISTRYNKVFDISERKNFCSGSCYKSAVFVKKQLFTSPLWFRDQEEIPEYKVLKSEKSSLGEEVVFCPDKIKPLIDEGKKNKVVENKETVDKSAEEEKNIDDGAEKEKDTIKVKNLEVECSRLVEVKDEKKEEVIIKSKEYDVIKEEEKEKKTEILQIRKSKPKAEKKTEQIMGVPRVEKSIFEWFSLNTLFYLYEEDRIKNLLADKASNVKEVLNSRLKMASCNDKIDKMIRLFGLLETDSLISGRVNTNLKPLPDYSALKEEGKTLNIKVRAFYGGQLEVKKPEEEEPEEEEPEKEEPVSEPNYMPLVDSHSQLPLRRKIVLDKLNRILPDLVRILSTDNILQMSEVRNLVSTFKLSAHNITFRPNEWYLVGIIIIKLLSLKDRHLESIIKSESSQSQLSLILMTYELPNDYLENFVQRLTDSSNIVKKLSNAGS